jgi:hypothetical protein
MIDRKRVKELRDRELTPEQAEKKRKRRERLIKVRHRQQMARMKSHGGKPLPVFRIEEQDGLIDSLGSEED